MKNWQTILSMLFILSLNFAFPSIGKANITADRLNILAFGAIPDDGNDDSRAIQEALNKAVGRTVYIPKGAFHISKTLILPSKTTIIAEDGATFVSTGLVSPDVDTLFDGKVYKSNALIYSKNSNNIIIKNLAIDVNKTLQKSRNVSALYLYKCSNIELDAITAKNNKMLDPSKGAGSIFLDQCTGAKIINCNADSIEIEGLLLRNCTHVTVKGGVYRNSTSSCVGTQYGDDILIDGIEAYNAANAVVSINSSNTKLIKSKVYKSLTFFPINLGHRTTFDNRKPADHSVVSDCIVFDGYQGGIHIGYGKDILVKNNEVYGCNGAFDRGDKKLYNGGISCYWWADEVRIIGNKIHDNMKGIKLRFGRKDKQNNEFTRGGSIVQTNSVYNNKFTGIEVSASADIVIESNDLYNNNTVYRPNAGEISIILDKTETGGGISITSNTIAKNSAHRSNDIGAVIKFSEKNLILEKPVSLNGNAIGNAIPIQSNYINHPALVIDRR